MDNPLKETLIGIFKASISLFPYGGALNEGLFEIRGRIAQKRINDFVDSFLLYLKSLELEYDENAISSEEFNDIYSAIIRRVIDTNNKDKLNVFRDILVNSLTVNYQSDFKETFLDLINRLDFIEIEILKMYENTGRSGSMDISEGMDGCLNMLTIATYKDRIIKRIKDNYTNITTIEAHGKYEFYICDLISKSLLIDQKSIGNTIQDLGREGLTSLYITDFGKEFLRFIKIE
ncbi:hypothetical protein SAMN05444162_0439 [Paenibacillaceae bacterium GAS479]|nr:hypothetical protein SAMN05444162_0439 [Paenibacillaceae bacterium GAS479]